MRCARLSPRVACSVSVRDFGSSWRSGEAFLAILCSLRPQLVDLSLARSRSNQENLEEAFRLAERELNIPRILEPQGEALSELSHDAVKYQKIYKKIFRVKIFFSFPILMRAVNFSKSASPHLKKSFELPPSDWLMGCFCYTRNWTFCLKAFHSVSMEKRGHDRVSRSKLRPVFAFSILSLKNCLWPCITWDSLLRSWSHRSLPLVLIVQFQDYLSSIETGPSLE